MSRYTFAFAAALLWGISPNIAKWGLIGGMPQGLGVVISTAAALPIYYALMVVSRRRFFLPRVDLATFVFVVLAGMTHTVGTLFQFAALKLEYISIVQSVINLNPLVAVFFLLVLGTEKVDRNLIIGTALVVGGSILVLTR